MTLLPLRYWRTLSKDERENWKRERRRYADSLRERGDRSEGVIYLGQRTVSINGLPEGLRETANLINETRRAVRETRRRS